MLIPISEKYTMQAKFQWLLSRQINIIFKHSAILFTPVVLFNMKRSWFSLICLISIKRSWKLGWTIILCTSVNMRPVFETVTNICKILIHDSSKKQLQLKDSVWDAQPLDVNQIHIIFLKPLILILVHVDSLKLESEMEWELVNSYTRLVTSKSRLSFGLPWRNKS